MQFEFIDYDGGFPNLCSGRLKFKADGKVYEEDGAGTWSTHSSSQGSMTNEPTPNPRLHF